VSHKLIGYTSESLSAICDEQDKKASIHGQDSTPPRWGSGG